MNNLLRSAAAHLAVMGMALITVSMRPGSAGASAVIAHVVPPVVQIAPTPVHRGAHVAPAGRRRHQRAHRRRHHHHHPQPASTGPTSWGSLNAAIARIPTYHPGASRWVVSGRYGHWGTADWYHDTLYISPTVPADRVYDVVVHEWSHELTVLDYHGNVDAAVKAMNRYFGGQGLTGAERAADCMAVLQGASWTHYTSCTDRRWREGAATLLRGRAL
jgi:hypothetical protein